MTTRELGPIDILVHNAGGDIAPLNRPDGSDGATFHAPVGSHPDGASPEGVQDLAGNVAEWSLPASPEAPATEVRGGSFRDEAAAALRTLGLAQLENERPGEAAETFRKLAALTPDDPLPYADLAVAALRQQKSDEAASAVAQALSKAPGRADLLALQGDVLQWSGKDEEALALYRKAAAAGPDQVVIQYALYRRASQGTGPDADAALREALAALVRLRPENLVVLLQSGQRAVAAGDRAGATQAFLRVRELIESAPSPAAATVLGQVLTALEGNDLAAARVPAIRLENVLKPTPAYQQGLRELAPGILGNPVERFATEPPPARLVNKSFSAGWTSITTVAPARARSGV